MSDTPRTDRISEVLRYARNADDALAGMTNFARTLEREIAELQTRLAHMSED